jgi:hypothetical protein
MFRANTDPNPSTNTNPNLTLKVAEKDLQTLRSVLNVSETSVREAQRALSEVRVRVRFRV